EARWDHWVADACAGIPSTLVHGDFRPKNAYVRDDGAGTRLFPIDWEMAGWGIPAADLTRVDLGAYWSVVRERWTGVDLETIERVAVFGQIFRLLAAISWETTELDFDAYEPLIRPLRSIRVLRGQLAEAIREAEARSLDRHPVSGPRPPATDGDERPLEELREVLRDAYHGTQGVGQVIGHQALKVRV